MKNNKKKDVVEIVVSIVLIVLLLICLFFSAYGIMALDKYLKEPNVVVREVNLWKPKRDRLYL